MIPEPRPQAGGADKQISGEGEPGQDSLEACYATLVEHNILDFHKELAEKTSSLCGQ